LEKLDTRVCYYDTDSVIYIDDGEVNVPLGPYLGDLTNELDDEEYIVEFTSTGPKSYSYVTNSGKTVCKVKGFSLNFRNIAHLNFEVMKDIVLNTEATVVKTFYPHSIQRSGFKLKSVDKTKNFKLVYSKRVIQHDLDTLPFGF